jgi:hypothetical protein
VGNESTSGAAQKCGGWVAGDHGNSPLLGTWIEKTPDFLDFQDFQDHFASEEDYAIESKRSGREAEANQKKRDQKLFASNDGASMLLQVHRQASHWDARHN